MHRTSGLYATVFIIVSVKLTDASVMVKNALHIGKDCMEAYAIKLPQGLYNTIRCGHHGYTHGRGINTGAVTTVDTEVIFNITLDINGSEGFDLHGLFSHELATIPTFTFLR